MEKKFNAIVHLESLPSHEIVVYQQEYHGTDIRIVEFDHDHSQQAGKEYLLPQDWRAQLTEELQATHGPIAPEYCMPDLEKHVFKELVTGWLARKTSEALGISPFFSHISKLAGMQGRTLLATDLANTQWYAAFEIASAYKITVESIARSYSPTMTRSLGLYDYGYEYGDIKPGEYQLHSSNDARHLVSARGLMQAALTRHDDQITSVWAPKHAERIADYIHRQVRVEEKSDKKVTEPTDFKQISPKEEQQKMTLYGRGPLHRSVREYVPTLPPIAYEIDLLLSELQTSGRLSEATRKMETYLVTTPHSDQEKRFRSKVGSVYERLHMLSDAEVMTSRQYDKIATVGTDALGWKLQEKNHIY